MVPKSSINTLGEYAEKYLNLVDQSQIPAIAENYLIVDMKKNLQNLLATANASETRRMRSKLALAGKAQHASYVALHKLVDVWSYSVEAGMKSAAEKIKPLFVKSLSEVNVMTVDARSFYFKSVLNALQLEGNKAAVTLLKIQPNIDNHAKLTADYSAIHSEYSKYCQSMRESSRAGYHKSLLEVNLRDFDNYVAVKAKEPKSDLWIALQGALAQNKEMFRSRPATAKLTPEENPEEATQLSGGKTDAISA